MKKKYFLIALLIAIFLLAVAACDAGGNTTQRTAREVVQREQESIAVSLDRMTKSQQTPTFDFSQERQTLIDILTFRANGATGTAAFYLEGVGLTGWCPSLGAPVSSTYQLTPSQQYVDIPNDRREEKFPVDQAEPTGVYVGESTGTWTICLDDSGKKFGYYWEGYVAATTASMNYPAALRIQPTDITFDFTDQEK